MADYFTDEHFELLKKWHGQKIDASNAEQSKAYADLKTAYEVTEKWAKAVQEQLFPSGHFKIRKRPTSQANSFFSYNWARIYPEKNSPSELAYTVGIDNEAGFVVKIDTVGLHDLHPSRKIYLSLRDAKDNASPIVALLSANEGLSMSLTELVSWSIAAIGSFQLSYQDLAKQLGLAPPTTLTTVLHRFKNHPEFVKWQPAWPQEQTDLFCRLVEAVNRAGLDMWLTRSTNGQIRFGCKEKEWKKGKPVGWITLLTTGVEIEVSAPAIPDLPTVKKDTKLSADVVEQMEEVSEAIAGAGLLMPLGGSDRPAFWPDDYAGGSDYVGGCNIEDERSCRAFNRIYYGPPGTGKTYELLQLLRRDYTDREKTADPERWLVEQMISRTWFEVIALVLLDLERHTKVADIVAHPFYQAKAKANSRKSNLTQTAWGYLQRHTWKNSDTVEYAADRRAEIAVFDKDTDSNWFIVKELKEQLNDLVPLLSALKRGPEPQAVTRRYEFVTFHQSYGYEEFVEGLRPETGGDTSEDVSYEIVPGPLRTLCVRAEDDPDRSYALVIDEINRGNISKIFGELITLIELDKRKGEKLAEPVRLPYSGDLFIIPPNVHFIGSMNTADRSLALVDTALRRRFEFIPKFPDPTVLKTPILLDEAGYPGELIDLQRMLEVMNSRIEALYDRDHTIGHAYFTGIAALPPQEAFDALKDVFQRRVIPLLEEYFFEDWQKIRLVLGDNQKEQKYQFVTAIDQENDLASLFGANHDLDRYAVRIRYQVNPDSFSHPSAYVGVYKTFHAGGSEAA